MSVHQTITIQTMTDVIRARMEVREAARRIGLDTRDQALISLAISALSDELGWGSGRWKGVISIEDLEGEEKNGLQVICTFKAAAHSDPILSLSKKVRWMVDAINFRDLVDDQVEVTLIKWAT
jgi:hypothetical protein